MVIRGNNIIETKVLKFRYEWGDELEQPNEKQKPIKLLVVGRKRAVIGQIIDGDYIEVIKEFTSGVPSRHHCGGWSQRRFERVIEQMENEFYKRISDHLEDDYYIVGGAGMSKNKFLKKINIKTNGVHDTSYDGGYEALRDLWQRHTKNCGGSIGAVHRT